MSDKYGIDQDPYCYPETNTLINLLDIRDEKILERAEQKLTVLAIEKISFTEPPYDFSYFKNIHQTLFSDIYEWAGEVRTVDISPRREWINANIEGFNGRNQAMTEIFTKCIGNNLRE